MWVPRTVNLRMALASIAFVALVGALLIQQHRSSERERALKKQLTIARVLPSAHERMRKFLGDMGIVILGEATRAEVLRVSQQGAATASPGASLAGDPVVLTGEILDSSFVRRLAGELLNISNYMSSNTFDDSNPVFGVRLWRGKESLDILFSLETRHHLDVWASTRNERDEVVHENQWYICMDDDELVRMVRETLAK